jgi:hypothetical protein
VRSGRGTPVTNVQQFTRSVTLRILVANIPLPTNRFLVDLNTALAEHVSVTHDSDAFWNMQGDYDVLHLHFPEYMTFELQDAYINGLSEDLIKAVRDRLEHWASKARIVVTRHFLLPHDALADPMWELLYETVYSFADGVVHFANASRIEFENRYRTTRFHREQRPIHAIIPHQNYESLPNSISREDARQALRIPINASVMLVFGAIRNLAERQLILDTFQNLQCEKKVLLVSRWMEQLPAVSWIRLKYWLRDLKRLYYRLGSDYRFNYDFVEEADTQTYLNAADVLFIPRFRVLNSGNVTLGMTFGRVVVGPDSWDVGELLKGTGNPVFDPDAPATASKAVEEGMRLAQAGYVGPANRSIALSEWKVSTCAAMYADFFDEVSAYLPSAR